MIGIGIGIPPKIRGGFNPNSIPGLGFWLESDYGITKDGSNAVSEWADRSTNGYALSQATGANQPIWTANEYGNMPGIIFDGTNDSLSRNVANPFGSVQNFTCFIVLKARINDDVESIFSLDDVATDSNSWFLTKRALAQGNAFSTNNVLGGTNNIVYGNTVINDNLPHCCISESNGSTWTERTDRIDQTLTTIGSNTGQAPGDFAVLDNINLGLLNRLTKSNFYSNLAAVLLYTSQLSTSDRTKVENYLINKYGVSA